MSTGIILVIARCGYKDLIWTGFELECSKCMVLVLV
jgi:hypothetical protein